MKQNSMRSWVVFIICLMVTATLLSCSDSESRLPFKSAYTKVIIDLGNKPKSGDMRLAVAPTGITSITVTVTGPGMATLTATFPPTQTVLELKVPSGLLRTFNVLVKTVDRDYAGTAIATLPAGQTVSVPVIMYPIGNVNEGSADAPVIIAANSGYKGTVGTGKSYYMTNVGDTNTMLSIQIFDLTDDADLISYGSDSFFINPIAPNPGESYCGRTMAENLFENYELLVPPYPDYYFVVDGSHTKKGASFIISCVANDGTEVGDIQTGDMEYPLIVPVGFLVNTGVRPFALNMNYYSAQVQTGKNYNVNYRSGSGTTSLTVYRDKFFTPYGSGSTIPFTAAGSSIYLLAQGSAQEDFGIEIVTSEGSERGVITPVEIYPDETFDVGRYNYCMVGGNSSSYYRVPITSLEEIDIHVIQIQGNVDLFVYNDPSYSEPSIIGVSPNPSNEDESFTVNSFDVLDGHLYLEIKDMDATGSTFVIYIRRLM